MNIDLVTRLAELHNTMGQFVQQKLYDLMRNKINTLDNVSKSRILDYLLECQTAGVTGVDAVIDKVNAMGLDTGNPEATQGSEGQNNVV